MTTSIYSTTIEKSIVYNRANKDYSCFLIIDGNRNLIGTVERYHDGEVLCNQEYQRLLEDNAVVTSDDEEEYNGENETLEGDIEFILSGEFAASDTIHDIATDGLTDIAETYLSGLSWSDRFDAITAIVRLMRDVVMASEQEFEEMIKDMVQDKDGDWIAKDEAVRDRDGNWVLKERMVRDKNGKFILVPAV